MSTVHRIARGLRSRSIGVLLVELAILVVGILLALGVDGWLERRREAAVAEESLELVRNDLVQLTEQARELEEYAEGVLEAASVVWVATDRPGLVEKDPATVVALGTLLARRTVRFPRAAYEELVATGNLRALANPDLRAALVRFYEELGRTEEIILRNNEAFTDGLLGRLVIGEGLLVLMPGGRSEFPLELQRDADAVWSDYFPAGPIFKGRLWDLPSGHPDRVRLLAVTASLSWAASNHLVIARDTRQAADALIDRIDAALPARTRS